MILFIGISTFVCITLAMMGVYLVMYRPQSAATERLKRLSQSGGTRVVATTALDEDRSSGELAQRLAKPVNRLLPPSAAEAKKLQQQLMHAGFRSPGAVITYRAIQVCALAGFPAAVAVTCALLARPVQSAILLILFAFVVGFFLPRYVLRRMVNSRQRLVRWGLADALDLMV